MPGQGRRPTLRDLCAAANVSVYTASRALGDFPDVAPATRVRVRASAKAIGYLPNLVARSLKHNVSQTVGVLTANNANRYYARLVRALGRTLQAGGYHCFEVDAVEDGIYSEAREAILLSSLCQHQVAGIILTYVPGPDSLAMLTAWRTPLVFVDCLPPPSMPHVSAVTPDNHRASVEVGTHFAALGYRTWLFLGHAADWTSRLDRERGFRDAAERCGADLQVIEGGNASDTAHAALARHLGPLPRDRWPRAIYASNEPLLNGAIRFLREARVCVPAETALVGFDDFDWADLMTPAITVVDQRIEEIGTIAGGQMLDAVAGRPPVSHVVRPRLRIRDSCGDPVGSSVGPAASA